MSDAAVAPRTRGIQPVTEAPATVAPAPTPKKITAKATTPEPPARAKVTFADTMKQINKQHGAQIIRPASEKPPYRHIPTGIFLLDMALNGGVPEGCATQFFGWESAGKTTIAARVAAAAQVKYPDKKVLFADFEGTYDPAWGRSTVSIMTPWSLRSLTAASRASTSSTQ